MEAEIVNQNQVRKWGHIRLLFKLLPILCILLYAGCAQVPKQSVELSATVGRDIAQVYKAHRELAVILYGRIKNDVNKLVDQVYAPYQIQKLLQSDYDDFKKGDPNALFSALDIAIKQPKHPDVQKTAFQAMDVFVQVVRAEIEFYREERLTPILAQEKEVLSAIDRSYNQIHYANSIVTGHLASIVKVHDAQEDLLNEFGIEGLRKDIGQKLSSTSNSIEEFVKKSKRVDGTVEEMEEKIKELTNKFDMLVGSKKKKEE